MATLFHLAVWTSGKRKNVRKMYNTLFRDIDVLFFWGQDKCRYEKLSAENEVNSESDSDEECRKHEWYKPLTYVWEAYPQFDESNTILIDDSVVIFSKFRRSVHIVCFTYHFSLITCLTLDRRRPALIPPSRRYTLLLSVPFLMVLWMEKFKCLQKMTQN